MDRRITGALVVIALTGLVSGVLHLRSGQLLVAPTRAAPAPSEPRRSARQLAPARTTPLAFAELTTPPLPASLRDTDEDGALEVDAQGNLVLSPRIRWFFEYYFAATGEEEPETIRARIIAAIRKKLPPHAATQAVALLDRYTAYREATRELTLDPGDKDDLAARLGAVQRLRREHLGADAANLFGEEERVDAVAVERLRIQQDPSLSGEEREQRNATLEERLPTAVREARAEAVRPLLQRAEEDKLLASGATDEEIRARRIATVGEEAEKRLAALDQQRAEWRKRLSEFRERRKALADAEPNPTARQAAIAKLLNESFTPEEQLRVAAADARAAEENKIAP